MMNTLQSRSKYPLATVYFTHSGTMLKMLSHLGLYKDEKHLLASDYNSNNDRKWKVSQIDPFGTNLAFVLHE